MPKVSLERKTDEFSIAFPTSPSLWKLARADELYKLDTLLEGGLYMARLDQFKDPREGALGRKTKSLLDKAPAYEKRYIIREYKNARRQSFASCWHRNDKDPSEYVWDEFGGKHNGFPLSPTPYIPLSSGLKLSLGASYCHLLRMENQTLHLLPSIFGIA